jgi:hypothetical protein
MAARHHKQVESGAAFQNESSDEEEVLLELGEEFAESEDFPGTSF